MNELIDKVKRYFSLTELVDSATYKRYGEFAWAFFDPRLLEVLIWLREGLNIPLVINTTTLQQRGLRTNLSSIVKDKTNKNALYMSAHNLGKGIDLSSSRKSAVEIRKWIRQHINDCPHNIRLEDDKSAPTWVHIDVMNITDKKLTEFSA